MPGNMYVCSAGEYFVASRLSAMGYSVGLTRMGLANVDLLVGAPRGDNSLCLQVKTTTWAGRNTRARGDYLQWRVGRIALSLESPGLFYAFVDLKLDENAGTLNPEVFIVPSHDVAAFFPPEAATWNMWPFEIDNANWAMYGWDVLQHFLGPGDGADLPGDGADLEQPIHRDEPPGGDQ